MAEVSEEEKVELILKGYSVFIALEGRLTSQGTDWDFRDPTGADPSTHYFMSEREAWHGALKWDQKIERKRGREG